MPLLTRDIRLDAACQSSAVSFAFTEPFSGLLALPCVKERWQEVCLRASKRAGLALALKKGGAAPANMMIGCVANATQVRALTASR